MSPIHKNLSYQAFDDPTGLAAYTVCVETGKLAGPNCVEPAAGYFFVESPPTATCDVCGVPGVDPNLPLDPNAPTTDPETPTVQPENPNTTPQDPITDPETPTEDPNKTPEETPSEPEDPVEGANPPAETETPIE